MIPLLALAALANTFHAGGTTPYDVQRLEGLAPGTFDAIGVNTRGEVAGRIFATRGRPAQAYLWSPDGLLRLDLPSGGDVLALNEDGVVVGIQSDPAPCSVFLWWPRSGRVELLPTPTGAFPWDLNEDLLIVGGDCDGLQGFALDGSSGTFRPIGFGPPPVTGVGTPGTLGVNAYGTATGSEVVFDAGLGFWVERPYLWSPASSTAGPVALETLSGSLGGRGVDVNERGDVAGYVIDDISGRQTALWPAGGRTVRNLGSPAGYFVSEALALNDHRQLAVVAPNDFFGYTRGFLWERGVFHDLSEVTRPATGLYALRAVDVNDEGEVLVQLGDAQGLVIRDVVLLRPVREAPRTAREGGPPARTN